MRRCKHEALVELSTSTEPCLVDPYRLRRLVETLPNPSQQAPLLAGFFGTTEKYRALGQLFPANDLISRDRRPAACKMYADALTSREANPIFFLDIDPTYGPPVQDTNAHCHEFRAFQIHQRPNKVPINSLLMSRLLLPFLDILCLFAEDLGGLQGVLQHLQAWADTDVTTMAALYPVRVIIVLSDDDLDLDATVFWTAIRASGLHQNFPQIDFEIVSHEEEHSRYIPLRHPVLQVGLEQARERRHERMHLFSGFHLASLFSQCLKNAATSLHEPFRFLEATRLGIPTSSSFVECTAAFLRATHDYGMPYPIVASLLASSLLIQACPPSAHGECLHYSRCLTILNM